MDPEPITFAVLGHNEAPLLANAVGQAKEAMRPGDRLWFVDGASTDGSGELAAALGAEVLDAPLGKGRAIQLALSRCETPYICLIDGDIEHSESNIPLTLARAMTEEPADMIMGDFTWPGRKLRFSLSSVYRPLVGALFPEIADHYGHIPFSGFRILRTDLDLGQMPPGFGVESHLNVLSVVRGWRTRVVQLGEYIGPIRRKPELGREVGTAILDVAEEAGRLESELRPRWEAWLEDVMAILVVQPSPDAPAADDYMERLHATVARPLPPAKFTED
ncbi:MAG: glucosyl-3-phosphoglycerate synthase [Thermoleophilaceae bacterium]|nr:glucosyl-3-phosphoglycerate synthase [Thermoleophilaceae bacterium]